MLTGTGSDGTLGLREIKAKGGLVLVQDSNEAEFDGMPQSAISTGIVDRVLSTKDLAATLLQIAKSDNKPAILALANGTGRSEQALLTQKFWPSSAPAQNVILAAINPRRCCGESAAACN